MAKKQAHVAPPKKEAVQRILGLIRKYPTIGVARIAGIPGPQMQKIRGKVRGRVEMVVSKNNLFLIALEQLDKERPGLKGLSSKVKDQTALVATGLNPFLLYKEMELTKQKSPARGGEAAPEDISVQEGETSFKPGPIVGELQKAGIPAGIEGGKVLIKKDKLLVKKGDRIPRELAPMLAKLEIFPMTVGLDLQAVWEEGTVYPANVLFIDDARVLADIGLAAGGAFNLAMFTAYPTQLTVGPLLARGHAEAIAVALEAGIPTPETVELLIGRAHLQARALKAIIGSG